MYDVSAHQREEHTAGNGKQQVGVRRKYVDEHLSILKQKSYAKQLKHITNEEYIPPMDFPHSTTNCTIRPKVPEQ